jgi:5-methylcytosine-specific restriction endonuclease McrA
MSEKQRLRFDHWRVIERTAIRAVGGKCQCGSEVCTGRATRGHHLFPRGRGGKETIENCLPVCRKCHRYIHVNVAWAEANGFILKSGVAA